MPIVPPGSISKSVKTGTPYSPAVSFNPDKKRFYDTHATTLGVLATPGITSDGVNVTVPAGTSFIQNGIIVTLTSPFVVAIPPGSFPKYVIASNVDETPGSAVTIEVLSVISAPQVELARLTPNNSTVVQAKQVSIRALRQDIDSIVGSVGFDAEEDDVLVKENAGTLNAVGPNVSMGSGPGDQVNIGVQLDVRQNDTPKTVRTRELDFIGAVEVIPSGPSDAVIDIKAGGGAISSTRSVMGDGIIEGLIDGDPAALQLNFTAVRMLKGGAVSTPFSGTLALTGNVSGVDRWDLLQWNGTAFTMKLGTPSCPSPDPGNIPVAVVLVPDSPSTLVRSMNKQAAISDPVIVAYYYANGGLHASRVGVTPSVTVGSTSYVDAAEMELSLYYPHVGYRYELAWDVVIAQTLYGFLNEGAIINASWDGVDEDENVYPRGYMHNDLFGGVSIHGFQVTVSMFYNRLVTVGQHTLKGRIKQGTFAAPEVMYLRRRRIWVHEIS